MEPLVSVVTITYNHEPYIAKCIEGVLMQQVDFPMEFIIAEDCSTDCTRKICEEYAEKYSIIHLITSDCNVGILNNERRAIASAKGKYIALCEGDDYWTDPLKLQKQIDFMESHPDYTVCFTNRMIEENGTLTYKDEFKSFCASDSIGFELTYDIFYHNWVTFPFTMIFGRSKFDLDWYDRYRYFRDSHMIFHFLQQGKAFVFSFVGGVRTVHYDSMYHSMQALRSSEMDMLVYKELYLKNCKSNERAGLKDAYSDRIQCYINSAVDAGKDRIRCFGLSFMLLLLQHSPKRFIKNLVSLI